MPWPVAKRKPKAKENLNFDYKQVEAFLIAFGDDDHPLPETVKVLDEIITEYVFPFSQTRSFISNHPIKIIRP